MSCQDGGGGKGQEVKSFFMYTLLRSHGQKRKTKVLPSHMVSSDVPFKTLYQEARAGHRSTSRS